CARDQTNYDYW
nr:immunoglobulin heavy chain junction region [Macaca mulatta]